MQDPAVSARLSDTKAASEVKALEDFYAMMQIDPNRAFYGLDLVLVIQELNPFPASTVIRTLIFSNIIRSDSFCFIIA